MGEKYYGNQGASKVTHFDTNWNKMEQNGTVVLSKN
jgi:hypothetical protein